MRGGLGNQLFQVAGAIHYAGLSNARVVVDDSLLRNHFDPKRRNWIKRIDVNQFLSTDVDIRFRDFYIPKLLNDLRLLRFSQLSEDELLQQSDFPARMKIQGWFQNSRYIKVNDVNIGALYSGNHAETLISDVIAIHLRFGDFLRHRWELPNYYYLNALELMLSQEKHSVHVYSDSPLLAEQIIRSEFPNLRIEFPESSRELSPLELMTRLSSYTHYISSNSTLSWWASIINLGEKDLIVFPKEWQSTLQVLPHTNLIFV